MRSKDGTELRAAHSPSRSRVDAQGHGLVPQVDVPVPARIAPVAATGVRAGHLARHRRPIGPVTVGRPMPAAPRGAPRAEPMQSAADALPALLRVVSSTAAAS